MHDHIDIVQLLADVGCDLNLQNLVSLFISVFYDTHDNGVIYGSHVLQDQPI